MLTPKKGFTLIELLIVIGIIGILAAAVIVVLNPAELLAQARDGTRLSDIDSVSSAVNLYIASVDDIELLNGATGTAAYANVTGACAADNPFNATCTDNTSTSTAGTGWVRVPLASISGGSPLPVLPTDPTNNTTYFYAYAANAASTTFEVDGKLESQRHSPKMTTDGGDNNGFYEKGTDLTL
jgi:prepilin-type N-terminal cleavage/methylation domain-containing protein